MFHANMHILNTAVDSTLKNGNNGVFYYVVFFLTIKN